MKRLWPIWLAFAGFLAVALAAMAWISLTALRLERTEARASRQADLEERVRLALWRMDSALAPLIARESARPYFSYTAFHPVDRAYTRMFAPIRADEVLVPSPLLTYRSPEILLHFQFSPSGELRSPQTPTGNQRDLAETGYVTHDQIAAAGKRLGRLNLVLARGALLAVLPRPETTQPAAAPARAPDVQARRKPQRDRFAQQQAYSEAEWQMRNVSAQSAAAGKAQAAGASPVHEEVREGAMEAVWVDGELLLGRRVTVGRSDYVQGCWLDWPHVRGWLVGLIEDLLPEAALSPAGPGKGDVQTCRLAALPVRLAPGDVPAAAISAYASPLRLSLLIAWACALLGALAVGGLLVGAVKLSQRRGDFVSAVTHELRTPLTTFRLYAEMLAEGMVTDEAKRADYLARLHQESQRLSHLVENVLAYARLSGRRGRSRLEVAAPGELVERCRDRLAARAEQAGMRLVVAGGGAPAGTRVRADASAVEQVLMNLVDNACKYAARAADRSIHVEVARQGRWALIRVRDHGPGIAGRESKRLFRAFCKSAREAAATAPGVGLGLALSRRLARDMGGDLRLDGRVSDGACLVLSLPVEDR